jgi:hypothetical protein
MIVEPVIKTAILVVVALAIVFAIGLAYWVNKDARRRTRNVLWVLLATALGLVPFVGPVVYLLFRSAETRDEVRARNAEIAAFDALVGGAHGATCPECSAPVEASYLVCPVCTARLREPCARCETPLDPLWQMCPHCATPVRAEDDLDLDVALTRELTSTPTLELLPEPTPQRAEI